MECYVCHNEITKENETEEHILLNAIGGKLKSKKLLCKKCNSEFGSKIDDALAKQLNPIANLLNIKRDRGKPQNIKGIYNNKEILLEPGGKIKLARAYVNKDINIYSIEASSEKQLKEVLRGLKRTHPEININDQIKTVEIQKSYLPSVNFRMDFGGEEISRAICKMAVNFFIYNGGNSEDIKHLLPFIEGKQKEEEVYFYYPNTEVFFKGEKEVLHTLILVGDPYRKQLYVYIELFNEFKMIVYLNKNYEGDTIYQSYHYNVITSEVVEYENPVKIPPEQLKKYKAKEIDKKKFELRMKHLLQRISNITVGKRIDEIIENALQEMHEKYPPMENPIITEKMVGFLSNRIADEYVLAFQHSLIEK